MTEINNGPETLKGPNGRNLPVEALYRQSTLGPLPAMCDDLYKSRLSGFSCYALNVVNWTGSRLFGFGCAAP
jgi:hypothetical protein